MSNTTTPNPTPNKTGAPLSAQQLLDSLIQGELGGNQGTVTLPDAYQLHSAGLPMAEAQKYGGKKVTLPATSVTGGTLTPADALASIFEMFPKDVQSALMTFTGISSGQYGNVSQSFAAVANALVAQKGNLGGINPTDVVTMANQAKELTTLQSGNQAALLGASKSAMYTTWANVDADLTAWGIDSPEMSLLIKDIVTNPKGNVTSQNEVLDILRGAPSNLGPAVDKTLHQTYETAFPGLKAYNSNPAAIHMTEQQYLAYSGKIMDEATQYGAPMPTQAQIGELLNHNVSATEYSQRVQDVYAAVANADPNVKQLLNNEFGINHGDIMQYLITGNTPKIKGKGQGLQDMQREVATAEIQDYATRVGLSGLGLGQAENLANMAKLAGTVGNSGLAYGVNQIQQSLLGASRDVELTKTLPGDRTPTVNTATLIAAQLPGFSGINQVAAQTQVARAEEAKVAPFEKGGGYAESAKGVVGLGSART